MEKFNLDNAVKCLTTSASDTSGKFAGTFLRYFSGIFSVSEI